MATLQTDADTNPPWLAEFDLRAGKALWAAWPHTDELAKEQTRGFPIANPNLAHPCAAAHCSFRWMVPGCPLLTSSPARPLPMHAVVDPCSVAKQVSAQFWRAPANECRRGTAAWIVSALADDVLSWHPDKPMASQARAHRPDAEAPLEADPWTTSAGAYRRWA